MVSPKNIRQPAVAGQFYPADKNELNKMIDKYLAEAEVPEATGTPQIIIVPHAGYVFSGSVAAYSFKTLQNKNFRRAVIVGRSHNDYFSGVAADTHDAWQTPLGEVMVDKNFIAKIKQETSVVVSNSDAHDSEHSLEVEVPFLIKTLGEDVKIVPLLFGEENESDIKELGGVLAELIDSETIIVISSDLSHYPNYQDANKLDRQTINAILAGDAADGFAKKLREQEKDSPEVATLACGEPAIEVALAIAQNLQLKPVLLKYANSGDSSFGDKTRVVGYASLAFYNNHFTEKEADIMFRELNAEEQEIALLIARWALKFHFEGKDYQPDVAQHQAIFQTQRGVFITLTKNGKLCGCIGIFEPQDNLAKTIKEMALAAAFDDPRFAPLQESELEDIEIEISVLSPRQKISDPDVIEVGKHGVFVRQGSRSGVYLPQVATEQGWNREQFLNNLCAEKAGLARDCWRDGSAELYVFTAQVFREEE